MIRDPMASARSARSCSRSRAVALALALAAVSAPSFADPPKPDASSSAAPSSSATAADPAAARRDRQARAIELHNEAKALYERGLYRRAIAKLEAALALDPEGKELVYNLALIHEKLAEADVAEAYYLRYIDMETDPKARERAQAIVKRLQGAKKNIKADLQERTGPASSATAATAAPSSTAAAPHVSRAPSPMVFVIGGVALAAVGVGIGFGASALGTRPGDVTTGPQLTAYELETKQRSAHTQAVIADLSFATSLVIGATAALLYLLETRTPRPAAPATLPSSAALPVSAPGLRMEAPF
jgi:tetratricopeptide (TPR) repeat protein